MVPRTVDQDSVEPKVADSPSFETVMAGPALLLSKVKAIPGSVVNADTADHSPYTTLPLPPAAVTAASSSALSSSPSSIRFRSLARSRSLIPC